MKADRNVTLNPETAIEESLETAFILSGYTIGAIGWNVSASHLGYGYLTMNLNAIINPVSLGGYT